MSVAISFAGQRFSAQASGALYWPGQDMLIFADLHLGKSERMARRGGALLPPFETRDTLARMRAEIEAVKPARLALLGDIFDDDIAAEALPGDERALFASLCDSCETLLIAGNHDRGAGAEEAVIAGITLRHIAGEGPDISGHYHPKMRLAGRARPAFLVGDTHLILPAFGAYTGGLVQDAPELVDLVPRGIAVMTGPRAHAVPLIRR